MRRKTIFIGLLVLLAGCSRGIWITQNAYRPKHPRFSIQKKLFVQNELINTHFLYVSKTKYTGNSRERILFDFTGLYPDGRMIGTSLTDSALHKIQKMNSWETAANIGYYTTEGNKILFEYFTPEEGGQYVTKQGIIKQDTIILSETVNLLLKKVVRNDTLVKTPYPLTGIEQRIP